MTDAPLRVLCVDDEPGLAELVAAYLERDDGIDCEAVAETDPETALDRIERAVDGDGESVGASADGTETDGVDPAADVALDGVCTVAPDGTFEFVGEEYGELYGYDSDELVGERWQRLHPDEEIEHIRTDVIPAVMEGEGWTGTSEGLRADGTTFAESKMVSTTADDRLVIAVSPFDEVAGEAAAGD